MTLKAKEVDRAWEKIGMVIKNSGDKHARFYVDGKLVVWTKRSMGSGTLDGQIPSLIRQQMKLNEDQFKELIDCPLKRDGYIQILREKKLL